MNKRYVVGFMYTLAGSVALVRKSRPHWQIGLLNGIGGKIEEGESPVQAQVREFREETGVETHEGDWVFRGTLSGIGWEIFLFASQSDVEMPLVNSDPTEPCDWYPRNPLPSDTVPNLRWLVPFCIESPVDPVAFYQGTHE